MILSIIMMYLPRELDVYMEWYYVSYTVKLPMKEQTTFAHRTTKVNQLVFLPQIRITSLQFRDKTLS